MGTMEECDIYRIYNHTNDSQTFLEEDGDYVYLMGPDSFIEYLSEAIDTYEEGEYFNSIGEGFSIKEIGWLDLPKKIRELYPHRQ